MKKSYVLPKHLDPKVKADLQEMARKFSLLPREEQNYIKGRMDAYKTFENKNRPKTSNPHKKAAPEEAA